jgi:hypothetical protein
VITNAKTTNFVGTPTKNMPSKTEKRACLNTPKVTGLFSDGKLQTMKTQLRMILRSTESTAKVDWLIQLAKMKLSAPVSRK